MRVRIECTTKSDRLDAHDRIRSVGGRNSDGMRWRLSEEAAIERIAGGLDFFIERPIGHTVRVVIATRLGHKYLKAETDGEEPDDLLSLPECP